jgi:PAT family beta-lactamase induction signal transducer AmpG
MRFPNLLATRRGRLAAFFLLYLTEGIPAGFTNTAVATQMRRQGLSPAVIGAFVGALYLPWAVKWAFGPFVDVLSSDRWGRRRGWILFTQAMMVLTILAAMPVSFTTRLWLFTAIVFVHNIFSATQDVAIDALAVGVLRDDERGLANGLMFGGQSIGNAMGGSGVLLLTPLIGFKATFVFVAGLIALVTLLVPYPMREPLTVGRPAWIGSKLRAIASEIRGFARDSARAFLGSRPAIAGLALALLPMGGYALSLSLQSNLAVELGLDDRRIGYLGLQSSFLGAFFCIFGGWLSDRYGRRPTLALFIAGTTLPTIAMAIAMRYYHWIMPISPLAPNRPIPPHELVALFWALTLVYAVFNGLMYGVGTAIFMDITTPAVAATQFTGYMALSNLCFSYSAAWQGFTLERWGYPATLTIDGLIGLVSIGVLPFMGRRSEPDRG